MSYLGKNIKKIRTIKKISQAEFAKLFELSRASIGAYEEGRAEAKIDTIVEIAKRFSITVDDLLTKELTVNELYHFDVFDHSAGSGSDYVDAGARGIFIPYVSIRSSEEYLTRMGQPDYIAALTTIKLPFTAQLVLRAFEHSGNEMYYRGHGVHHGDFLICSISDSKKIKNDNIYVVVLADKIITRRIMKNGNKLELITDNPGFDSVEIMMKEIIELWEVKGRYSTIQTNPLKVEDRVDILEAGLKQLRAEIDILKQFGDQNIK